MRLLALAFLLLLAGCASGYDIRPPATAQERAETNAQIVTVSHITGLLRDSNLDVCGHMPDRCVLHTEIGPGDRGIAAGSDGKKVKLNLPLLRFLQNDSERAMVIAHEWTHNLVHWPRGEAGFGKAAEFEADCIGTLMVMRAGYDARQGAEALRRMAGTAQGIEHARYGGYTHPTWSERHTRVMTTIGHAQGRQITRDTIRQVCGIAP